MLAGTTFTHVAPRQKHLSALFESWRNFGECWCGVHWYRGFESRLVAGGQTLSMRTLIELVAEFLKHLVYQGCDLET